MSRAASSAIPWRALFRGCVREALAEVYSVARIGLQETRAWESPLVYAADDNQGNVALVEFFHDGAIGAATPRAARTPFDRERSLARAPAKYQQALRRLCGLPLLEGDRASAIFWTHEGALEAPDGWEAGWESGMFILEHELLPDARWIPTGEEYWEMAPDALHLPIEAATRAKVCVPICSLSELELRMLIPRDAPFRNDALGLLTDCFAFPTLETTTQ